MTDRAEGGTVRKLVVLVLVTALIVLALVSVAGAVKKSTPWDIYNDYAKHGRLTGTYTQAELEAYLNDATVHQYGNPAIYGPLDDLVRKIVHYMEKGMTYRQAYKTAVAGVSTTKSSSDDPSSSSSLFPFTGFEIFGTLAAAGLLLGSGILIRRWAR
jgi:hypothetical protein